MILNFGSINVDYVYQLAHIPQAGETVQALSHSLYLGGKGVNQSIAVARAGGRVKHIGCVGPDGDWALQQIVQFDVDTDAIAKTDAPTGHAIILLDRDGENRIVIEGGANLQFTETQIDKALASVPPEGNWILLQNETNLAGYVVSQAKKSGFKVAYSAAPFVAETTIELLDQIDLLAVNAGEAEQLANTLGIQADEIPVPLVLITRGAAGATLKSEDGLTQQGSYSVEVVDTTGAGDTFLGSFLAYFAGGAPVAESMDYAAAASALQVTRHGAAPAIPLRSEVEQFLKEQKAK